MSEKKSSHADKFTWTEDEIEVVGHEPVTDEDRRRVLREHDRR